MAEYYSPTIVQPIIPLTDMTAVELLLLTHVFEYEDDGDGLYFFAEICMNDMPDLDTGDVRKALAEDAGIECGAAEFLRAQLARRKGDGADLQLDREVSWEQAFQDIVRRSETVQHVEVVTAFTCSKMRPDGFGGAVTIITADQVLSSSTEETLCELLDKAEFGEIGVAPGHGSHVLLRLSDEHVRATLEVVFETEAPEGLAIEQVTDADIRQAALDVKAAIDLSHEEGEAAFKAALRAICLAAERKAAA